MSGPKTKLVAWITNTTPTVAGVIRAELDNSAVQSTPAPFQPMQPTLSVCSC